ncbi:MAG: ABC transporter permease [Gammaproteobacteria bacterium]|nr:ABC transporter permease [Gammaproteobacteria bacterium]MYH45373.1 ABC transporter permease [Gammaproteobacteria bacterium]MYL14182.1 ABC transporter permease [Gammaproteobacteria bacterium]
MFQQTFNITAMNLQNILSRKGSSSIIVVGIAGVVGVVVGLLSMSEGIQSALTETSHPDRVLVMRTGTQDEITGWLSATEVNVLKGVEGLRTVSGELVVVVDLVTKGTGKPGVAIVRGVEASAFELRPDLRLVAGRSFQPGRNELLVGVNASDTYEDLTLGSKISFRNTMWDVVGLFDAEGQAHDSEVWMDLPIAQTTFRRDGVVSNARALFDSNGDAAAVSERISQEPRLRADLVAERDFYVRQSQAQTGMLESFAYLIGAIMGLGAVVASINTMYSSVSTRSVEIGTLRALGFSNVPVVVSVMVEALLLALVGGLLGSVIVYLLYDGFSSSTLNVGSMSQVAFEFSATPRLLLIGLASALLLGAIGGLLPALRAARLPVIAALRSG